MFCTRAAQIEPAMRGPCIKVKAIFPWLQKVAFVSGTTGVCSSRQVQREPRRRKKKKKG